jgi:RNA recognition motif-containing protein
VVAEEEEEQGEKRRKLYVANLPWSFPAPEIEKLFAQHGTVKDVEVGGVFGFRERNAACPGEPLRPACV